MSRFLARSYWLVFILAPAFALNSAFSMTGGECAAVADAFNKHDRPWFINRAHAGGDIANYWTVCLLQDGVYKLRKEYTLSANSTEKVKTLESSGVLDAVITEFIDGFKNDYCVRWQRGPKTGQFVWAGDPYVYVLKTADDMTFRTFEMTIDSCAGR